jgi:hypothetical protein
MLLSYCLQCVFGGKYRLHHQGDRNQRARKNFSSNLQLVVTVNVVTSPLIPVTLMIEPILSSKPRFLEEPRGLISQKTAFFIVTAVKTLKVT